jgi:recombination protein RecA
MTEMKFDKAFAKWKCGVQVAFSPLEIAILEQAARENGAPPFTEEQYEWLCHQMGTFHEAVFATAEQLLETAVQQVESNLYQVVLIDSFGALLTTQEAEDKEGLEGKHYGGASGVITQFMHRLHAALNLPDKNGRPNTTTVLGINQYRENLKASGPYANPLQIAGGRALKHGKLVDVLLEKGAKIWVGPKNAQACVGREVRWSIIKGKAGCHDGPKGDYRFYYGDYGYGFGADVYHNLLLAGVQAGIIEQSGAWFSYKGEHICQGQDNAAKFFMDRPEYVEVVRQAIFNKHNIHVINKETF